MAKAVLKPRMIMLSKRANVFYLEHCRIMQKDERVIFLNQTGSEIESYFNLPERNTIFLLLGKGTSITDSAARRLAESNVMFGFVGNGGSPAFAMSDMVFLTSLSEYRPTEYMQAWAKLFFDEEARLGTAINLIKQRMEITTQAWKTLPHLQQKEVTFPEAVKQKTLSAINSALSTTEVLTAEGRMAKTLYAILANRHQLTEFKREDGKQSKETIEDIINGMIDQGNYIAYGYAASAIHVLGISFAMPVLHGKTRRGGLVFDIADLVKDAYVLPLAFEHGATGQSQQAFRDNLIEVMIKAEVIEIMIEFIQNTIKAVQPIKTD